VIVSGSTPHQTPSHPDVVVAYTASRPRPPCAQDVIAGAAEKVLRFTAEDPEVADAIVPPSAVDLVAPFPATDPIVAAKSLDRPPGGAESHDDIVAGGSLYPPSIVFYDDGRWPAPTDRNFGLTGPQGLVSCEND
jgi:hypothetical protein